MIGRLKGELLEKYPPQLVIDVNGVGYEVDASMNTFYQLPEVGRQVTLFTHMVVREDAQLLYGFYERSERSLFRTLIKVNGVGPKLALTILSGISVNEFVQSVQHQDTVALVRLPGVGKKTAERLIVEMQDKLKDFMFDDAVEFTLTDDIGGAAPVMQVDNRAEAESALVALGYKPVQASKSIAQAEKSMPGASSEELIRAALKSMVQG
ncbi:Holliday junction branch migration protein RuvA [Amphritea sp. 1_MG-2023]|uniref:Holliday junction branch migration protein RuvA n=1 Tax=Amphritea sp. 1_MG-2023 TaxID=3062670 RepID=UPI0026E28358|nr:Holliday junction branch migration protein RuvA [Amphritea sp. 1_MG-2023]MDO6562573.1 Holliday junction branch migration protein RuvA [Amphritea sp. 1_MG-2023]